MKLTHCLTAFNVAGIAAAAIGTVAALAAGPANETAKLWADHCIKCHGDDGRGETKMGRKLQVKDYTKADVQKEFSDADAFKAIKEGRKDKNGKALMKAAEGLSDEDMQALVRHVRALKK